MSKTKPISFKDVDALLYYSEDSPSGLRWKVTRQNNKIKAGEVAGCISKQLHQSDVWVVSFLGGQHKAHRVIWSLIHGVDMHSQCGISHKDGNSLNNHIDNLHYTDFSNPQEPDNLDILDYVEYCEDSPTKLCWKVDRFSKTGQKLSQLKGKPAGHLESGRVTIRFKTFSILRVVLLIHGISLEDNEIVKFKDGNYRNYSIENIEIQRTKISIQKERRAKYREAVRENKIFDAERRMVRSAKERALKNGIPFDITYKDVVIPKMCPILGVPLLKNKGTHGFNSPSLDRKDPSKGYTKDNIWVISYKANTMKNDANKDFLINFAKWVLSEYC